ncbi:GNAT family N-acetyltransferase [Polymorphospora lycopeni]|uniref:GNAT family N-acetyltransferase n=1 Tax=Polymorphospora lycopeni TaxID=3140240 RepID=A0ABV5D329_9ACTN
MTDVVRGDELGEESRRPITEVLVGGFAEDFAYFSPDPAKVADAFAHMILPGRFHVALVDGKPAAVASLTTGEQQCFAPKRREFRRHLGFVHGTISHLVVRSQFMGVPDDAGEDVAEIGFVTTAPAHQGRGVATALLTHLLALPEHRTYVLQDIKDTNVAALALYRKLGFTPYRRRPVRFARRAGFTEYVSMRLEQRPPSPAG